MVSLVITGSSKGIGYGLAREFARRGHQVMLSGGTDRSVTAALDRLREEGLSGEVIGTACDVSAAGQVQALWNAAATAFGNVDIWINNAGVARTTWTIRDTPDNQITRMAMSNLVGTALGCKVAVNGMLAQGHGKIFNMLGGGSNGEFFPGMGIYGATKRGLDYLTDALVKENRSSNLVIAKIRPGMIVTEGVIREIRTDPGAFERSRGTMNVLCDSVETVAPFLVDEILKCDRSGSRIAWLSGGRIAMRMLKARFVKVPDKFEQYGL